MKSYIQLSILFLILLQVSCTKKETKNIYYDDTDKVKETIELMKEKPEIRDGKSVLYYLNGKIQHEAEYKKGVLWSVDKVSDTSGKIIKENPIKEGSGILPIYDRNGLLIAELNYKSGYLEGESSYFDQGTLISKVAYRVGIPEKTISDIHKISLGESNLINDSTQKSDSKEKVSISGFDAKQSDELMTLIQKKSYTELHSKGTSDYQKDVPLVNLTRYLNYCIELYGPLKSYSMEAYQIKSMRGMGEGLEVAYQCQFGYCKGIITLTMFRENGKFALGNIDIMVAEHTPVIQITRMASPVLDKMKVKDFEGIYQNAAPIFKSNTPINEFRAAMAEFGKIGTIDSYELYQHNVAFRDGRLSVATVFKIKIDGKEFPMSLIFMEEGNTFKLAGFNM